MSNRPGYELALQATVISISVLVALIIGEIMLRVYAGSVSQGEHMEPGLIRYHSRYGWRLSPSWQGRHQHVDYDVRYEVNPLGFRKMSPQGSSDNPLALVVGDSFTFGLGVGTGATYVDYLSAKQSSYRFLNAAVPGYAPEQTLLVAENLTPAMKPKLLVYAVYLGNDLIDLGLPFPIQADQGKPVGIMEAGRFDLTNLPVPKAPKPPEMKQLTLANQILLEGSGGGTFAGLKLVQLIQESGLLPVSGELDQEAVFTSLELFDGVLDRLVSLDQQTDVVVLLIPGATAIRRPESLSGRYQALIADEINKRAQQRQLHVIDLSALETLRGDGIYFPNDGHFTVQGHEVVAEFLAPQLKF